MAKIGAESARSQIVRFYYRRYGMAA